MRAVRGAERVVHIDVAQRGHLAAERFIVLRLTDVEPAVLQQHQLTRRGRAAVDAHAIDPVGHQRHRPAQQLADPRSDRCQRVFGRPVAFLGAAQVRGDHHRGPGLQRGLDAGQRRADAGVVGDAAGVVLRHVEVDADEHPLARDLVRGDEIGESCGFHGEEINWQPGRSLRSGPGGVGLTSPRSGAAAGTPPGPPAADRAPPAGGHTRAWPPARQAAARPARC